jgi:hypothetical protein
MPATTPSSGAPSLAPDANETAIAFADELYLPHAEGAR